MKSTTTRPVEAGGASPWGRRVLLALGIVALGLYGGLAFRFHRSLEAPDRLGDREGGYGWIVGPPARTLSETAENHLRDGLRVLSDASRPPAARIEAYQEHLAEAERLLIRSVRAQPAQAQALAQLAAIRWELDPAVTEDGVRTHLELIELASRMSPRSPRVQKDLGELLLKMGRRREALDYLGLTVELEPAESQAVVTILSDHLFSAREMFEALPRVPELLVALQKPFFAENEEIVYADALEGAVRRAPDSAALLRAYGNACLRAGDPERLAGFLDGLDPPTVDEVAVERLVQSSRAHLGLGRSAEALDLAEKARALEPDDPRLQEHFADIAFAAGDAEAAIPAFRLALALVARESGNPSKRARLYRKIGQALERREEGHLAYDAYKKALALDPEEPTASRRVAEMEKAAGVRTR